MSVVLDHSALLAYLHNEPGADLVEPVLAESLVSAVNWSELVRKSLAKGVDTRGLREDIEALGIEIEAFASEDAECAAQIWPVARKLGLSLGDRACLALGLRLRFPVFTADRTWLNLAEPLKLVGRSVR